MNPYTEVLFEELSGQQGDVGVITLNRPQVLNSLNQKMILAMYNQLQVWEKAPHIKAVVIKATEGRAFCAGGDLRHMYDGFLQHDPTVIDFFRDEYRLNRYIFHFPKPYIALLDGITMGGGVGVSIHGSHRIATDRLLFAMPETGIGFYPDVGGTYFLPRLENTVGFYLGLVGTRLAADDCVALGIAQQKVAQQNLPQLIQAIVKTPFETNARQSVTNIIEQFKVAIQPQHWEKLIVELDTCFSFQTVEDILSALKHSEYAICQTAYNESLKKSPTSLKVTLKALLEGKKMDFDHCMDQELMLTTRFIQSHDFIEGIRAVIIDKDQNPQWNPQSIEEVTNQIVNEFFQPLMQASA